MKVGIMQPYFFPYIGYWQLINVVDRFIIYDDVNYIKKGWINRNRILINGEAVFFNLRMNQASQNKLINQMEVLIDDVYFRKLIKTIESCYCKAPYFNDVFPIIEKLIMYDEINLTRYLEFSIRKVCEYLSINTEIIISSSIEKNNELRGQQKIIEICRLLNADQYINAIGGQSLYNYIDFLNYGIKLMFIKTQEIKYIQFNNNFIPNLSIIDLMMFNSRDEMKKFINMYTLI